LGYLSTKFKNEVSHKSRFSLKNIFFPKNSSYVSDKLNSSYCENLKKLGQTDTLIAVASS